MRLSTQLYETRPSQGVIEQPKGIIMGERQCSEDEAFQILSKASQDSNRKLWGVASALVEHAALPNE